jgi:DNA invertase Pin-like site-specific DNA recombinase
MMSKISASHLERRACVYIRQSTSAQVLHHTESTDRQYALVKRAESLGWSPSLIEVIDEDLGKSGATTEGRSGFARLVDDVAHGLVGAVAAVEVSRLSRSSDDWRRLLSLCAVADVVVIDEQAVYDPNNKDDKLLLDIKGTMSEAELHWLSLRLTGARLNKARRGELRIAPPTGYVWGGNGYKLDPDEAVQRAVKLVFDRYEIETSAWAVLHWARAEGLSFPVRRYYAGGGSEVAWKPLGLSRLHEILINPVYAGVYAYGRRPKKRVLVDGEICQVKEAGRDPEQWKVKIVNAHPGYISWERFVANQRKLHDNGFRFGSRGAAREGRALLQGMLICGRCGRRMWVSYVRNGSRLPYYNCFGDRDKGEVMCWSLPGGPIDEAVEDLWLKTVVPDELELCLAVEHHVDEQVRAVERQWKLRLEKVSYEARLAERRYKAVDPDNRVVTRTLEQEWEIALGEVEQVKQQFEQAKRQHHISLTDEDRQRIRRLAKDLPAVWRSETTKPSERKAMLRLGIEAVSLKPVEVPERSTLVKVQWRSGAVTEILVPRPSRHQRLRTPRASVNRLRELADAGLHDKQIAEQLNKEGYHTGRRKQWNLFAVKWARRKENIKRVAPDMPRAQRLPDRHPDGRYSVAGAAKRFGVTKYAVRRWLRRGIVSGAQESYESNKNAWWLFIDEKKESELKTLINALPRRTSASKTTGANT